MTYVTPTQSGGFHPQVEINTRGRKIGAMDCKGPIFLALIILGVIGIGVGVTGLASFGNHQAWWPAGGLSHLSQIQEIIMMSMGGLGIILLSIGTVKIKSKPQNMLLNDYN